jgi:hypothetical protein
MSFDPITPVNLDPHAEGIGGPTPEAFSDPEISRLDLMENRPGVREHVSRRVHVEPKRYKAIVTVQPDPYQVRESRYVALWIGFYVAVVLVVAVIGWLWATQGGVL